MNVIELIVMMLLGIVVLFVVIRPLVKRILSPEVNLLTGAPQPALPAVVEAAPAPTVASTNAMSNLIDVAQVQGQVHAQSVHRVGELADRNPHETVAIIRQWLQEPAA